MVVRSVLSTVLAAAWLLLAVMSTNVEAASSVHSVAFAPRNRNLVPHSALFQTRGGATVLDSDDEEEDSDVESEDESESEEEDEEFDAVMAASAAKAAAKSRARKAAATKQSVNAKLAKMPVKHSKKKSSTSILKMLHVPYILRALLNPITIFTMAKGYWASLFNLDYLKADASQELRSALEQKARQSGSSGNKGKRKFKRGQAKTLSDLPKLNT